MSQTEKTTFGIPSLSRRTPTWVKTTVAISMLALGSFNGWVYGTDVIKESMKKEIMLINTTLMGFISAVAPLFGKQRK